MTYPYVAKRPTRLIFGHPSGLVTLFLTEMWERFSGYGMRAILVLFLVDSPVNGGLGLAPATAAASTPGTTPSGTSSRCRAAGSPTD